ncbi:MAG: hypothetical protein F6K35_38350, partial [Okeania sp. SIO2H7]|nr:hypothetical protein [Okeania sp. SIO2H7]
MVAIAEEKEQLKAQLQEAERERDKTKSELHDIREELERTQSQLDEVLGELEQTHFELHQLKEKQVDASIPTPEPAALGELNEELKKTKSQLQISESELGKTKSELQETKEELERTYSQLDQIMGELEESNFELHQLKEKGQSPAVAPASKEELEKCQRKLLGARNQLQQTQAELQKTQEEMQTIKAIYSAHVTNTLLNVLLPTARSETLNLSICLKGSLHQRERLASVAEYCMKGWGGDLIEIGCYKGETTRLLSQMTEKEIGRGT